MHQFLYFLGFLIIFNACGSRGETQVNNAQDTIIPMVEQLDDPGFKAAHDIPIPLGNIANGHMISLATVSGDSASVYVPADIVEGKPFLLVVHEWWGLNEHIKREADRYYRALDSINVMALDLYDGEVAETREEAMKLVRIDRTERINEIFDAVFNYVGDTPVGTIGWCYGGGYSLRAAIHGGGQVVACVMFYGTPVNNQEKLAHLQAPVLAIWASQDKYLTPEVANEFKESMEQAGKIYQQEFYDADHAFANPSSHSYVKAAAQMATHSAIAYLRKHLLKKSPEK